MFQPKSGKPYSWYGGSWGRGNKATAVTQVAKESISAASGMASEAVASARSRTPQPPITPVKSPTLYLNREGSSSRSLPLAATTTKFHITSNASNSAGEVPKGGKLSDGKSQDQTATPGVSATSNDEKADGKRPKQDRVAKSDIEDAVKDRLPESKSNRDSLSWLTWFSKNTGATNASQPAISTMPQSGRAESSTMDHPQGTAPEITQDSPPISKQRTKSDPGPLLPEVQQEQPPRSWLSLWGNATTQPLSEPSESASTIVTNKVDEVRPSKAENAPEMDLIATPRPPPEPTEPAKSYAWAFWSKDEPKPSGDKKPSESMSGELAQADSPTQSKPENASIDQSSGIPEKVSKRQRPQSLDSKIVTSKPKESGEDQKKPRKSDLGSETAKSMSLAVASLKASKVPENLLLPSFNRTYSPVEKPGIIQQLGRLFQSRQPTEPRHIDLVQNPARVRKALAIGVHGYFPAPLIRSVLGQPTGTSIRFANGAATAIQKWARHQGYSCDVEKVALEGEGKIAERVDLLWKLMVNWLGKIQNADFVMIACHSQGVPVAMMLVAKLIATGCVGSAKVGVCAMAGVNLGPFADYKSRWISGSAGELFDFARPESQVSKDYETALDVALKFGVKIVYVGSIDDQLVSLDSSTFGNVSHPYIYRAVFVDGRVHAPDFLTHLVGFALKLRNLGISDHGLIRELSSPLAGSLYSGEGHSRIYDDDAVYYLAVRHALETTNLSHATPAFSTENNATAQNPYILPFAMRGLLEEEYVRTELVGEVTELINQFDNWKPSSKVLKDVKFRLEGVRSKL